MVKCPFWVWKTAGSIPAIPKRRIAQWQSGGLLSQGFRVQVPVRSTNRDGRAVDCIGLENRSGVKVTMGSNPILFKDLQ